MVSWDFWHGLDLGVNDTWSIAYEFKQKFQMSEMTAYTLLATVEIICLVGLIWIWKRKRKV